MSKAVFCVELKYFLTYNKFLCISIYLNKTFLAFSISPNLSSNLENANQALSFGSQVIQLKE